MGQRRALSFTTRPLQIRSLWPSLWIQAAPWQVRRWTESFRFILARLCFCPHYLAMELKEGTFVVLHDLNSTYNYNGLLCTVKKITDDDRIAVRICETDKSIKVKRKNIFYPQLEDEGNEREVQNPSTLVPKARLPPILSSMQSLLAGTRKISPKDVRFNHGLGLVRANMNNILADETSNDFTRKCACFLMADACFLQTDYHGVVKAIDEYFPLNSSLNGAWGDIATMGPEVIVAVQNLATAKGIVGSSSDELAVLMHAVDRFSASPLPRYQLLPLHLNIALSLKAKHGPAKAIPWLQKAVDAVTTPSAHPRCTCYSSPAAAPQPDAPRAQLPARKRQTLAPPRPRRTPQIELAPTAPRPLRVQVRWRTACPKHRASCAHAPRRRRPPPLGNQIVAQDARCFGQAVRH